MANIFTRIVKYIRKHPGQLRTLVGEGTNYIDLLWATPWRIFSVFWSNSFVETMKTQIANVNVGSLVTLGYIPILAIGTIVGFKKIEAKKIAKKDISNFKGLCKELLKINPQDEEAKNFIATLEQLENLKELLDSKTQNLTELTSKNTNLINQNKNTGTIKQNIAKLQAEISALENDIKILKTPIDNQASIFLEEISSELAEEGALPYSLEIDINEGLPKLKIVPPFDSEDYLQVQNAELPNIQNNDSDNDYEDRLVNKKNSRKHKTELSTLLDNHELLITEQTDLSLLIDSHVDTPYAPRAAENYLKGTKAINEFAEEILNDKNLTKEKINSVTQKLWDFIAMSLPNASSQTLDFLGDDAFYFWILWSSVLFAEGMDATTEAVNAHIMTLGSPIFPAVCRILQFVEHKNDKNIGKLTEEYKKLKDEKAKQKVVYEKIQTIFLIKRKTAADIKKFLAMQISPDQVGILHDEEQGGFNNYQILRRYDSLDNYANSNNNSNVSEILKPRKTIRSHYDVSLGYMSTRSITAGALAYIIFEFLCWVAAERVWLGAKFWVGNNDLADRTGADKPDQTAADITLDISIGAFVIYFIIFGFKNFRTQKQLQKVADQKLLEKTPNQKSTKAEALDNLIALLENKLNPIEALIKENHALLKKYNELTPGKKLEARNHIPSFRKLKAGLYTLQGYFDEQTLPEKIYDYIVPQALKNDFPDFGKIFHQKTTLEHIDDYGVNRIVGNFGSGIFLYRSVDYNWFDILHGAQENDFWQATLISIPTIALRWIDKRFQEQFSVKKNLTENLDTYEFFLNKQMEKLTVVEEQVLKHNKRILETAIERLQPKDEQRPLLVNGR